MKLFLLIVEKILWNVILSAVLFVASFSYFTGKFPPRKDDFRKAYALSREMFFGAREASNGAAAANSAKVPNFAQVVEIQKINLRRTEAALKLTELFERLPKGELSAPIAEHLKKASDHLTQVDLALEELNKDLKQLSESQ